MISHKKFEDMIIDNSMGKLSEKDQRKLKLHLASCSGCREFSNRVENLFEFTDKIRSIEVPDALRESAKETLLSSIGPISKTPVIVKLEVFTQWAFKNRLIRIAAAVVFFVAAIEIGAYNYSQIAMPGSFTRPTYAETGDASKLVTMELSKANGLYIQKDSSGLIGLLEDEKFFLKDAVAQYLGKLGDASAIPHLRKLADKYQGTQNPYTQAIIDIQNSSDDAPADGSGSSYQDMDHTPFGILAT